MTEAAAQNGGAPIDELNAFLDEAQQKLASSQLGAGAGFHNLPVIFLIGPEGSGKTTAMMQSGLDPELLAGEMSTDKAISPTGLANLWYAGKTLFVEPGAKVRADPALWHRLLQRMRTKEAVVRAAIVFHGCDNSAAPKPLEAATESAGRLRVQLNEMSKTLGIQLPVYVLYSKLDKVRYFQEYVAHLEDRETAQVLGTTLPHVEYAATEYGERENARLGHAFEALTYSLCDKRVEFLARETDGALLGAVYEFPREFTKLRAPLVRFLVELCRPGQLQPIPFLRGFYFSGMRPVNVKEQLSPSAPATTGPATPEGADPSKTRVFRMDEQTDPSKTRAFRLDEQADPSKTRVFRLDEQTDSSKTNVFRVEEQPDTLMTRAFRFDPHMTQIRSMQASPRAPRFAVRKVEQWILLKDLFSNVLLHDVASLEVAGARGKTNQLGNVWLAVAAVLFVLLLAGLTNSFLNNRALLHAVRDSAGRAAANGNTPNQASLEGLEALRKSLGRLSAYERNGAPWPWRFGLYAGSSIHPEARQLYFDRFKDLLLNDTLAAIERELGSLPSAPGSGNDYTRAYESLKAWLEMTSHHNAASAAFLAPVLEDRWARGRAVEPQTRNLARAQFEFYASELKDHNPYSIDERPEIVGKARHYLAQFDDSMRVYKVMVAEVNGAAPPLSFNRRYPDAADVVADAREIPNAFTKDGFDAMRTKMQTTATTTAGDDWVLHSQSAVAPDQSMDSKVKAMYFDEFREQWRAYLRDSAVLRFADLKDAARRLTILSGAQSPLLELLNLAVQNTSVDAPEIKNAFAPLQALTTQKADTYKAALGNLSSAAEAASTQPADQNEASARKLKDAAGAARLVAEQIAESLGRDPDGHIETIIGRLLAEPIVKLEAVFPRNGPDGDQLNVAGAALCGDYGALFSKRPFQPNAKTAATLDEVNAIFRPHQGALWTFYETNLKSLLVKQDKDYVIAPGAQRTITPHFLEFFNQAMRFSEALYQGGQDPKLSFTLSPTFSSEIQSVTLSIDGQTVTLTPDMPAKQFSWPGDGVRMTAKGPSDYIFPTYGGLWGVFDFFYDADKPPPNPEWIMRGGRQGKPLLSPLTNQPVVVRFRLDMQGNPPVFQKDYMKSLACVPDVDSK